MLEQELLKRLNEDGWKLDPKAGILRREEQDSEISVKRATSGRYSERLPTNRRRKRQKMQAARRDRRAAE